ncbi:hypothetical protein [Reyranella sp. CPCC 100927]|uniref:hypothetical protein n=1 Tax=Reyranella sp. CPCC 100927 TaxID=2599616 RepID=UPI001C499112|nr:hypothetical protein [Reyranella sp. CPCC 100927]
MRDLVPEHPHHDQCGRDPGQDQALALDVKHTHLLSQDRFDRHFVILRRHMLRPLGREHRGAGEAGKDVAQARRASA